MTAQAKRLINRRQQGDLGEACAIEWLTRQGANVCTPLGHSPDFDLVAEIRGHLLRIQVKTTTQRIGAADGHERYPVSISTNGGNQSWSGLCKHFDPDRCDYLFVLAGSGRRWFVPSHEIHCSTGITFGGPKYAEFEIEPGAPIGALVYRAVESDSGRGSAGVGEPGRSVKSVPQMLSGFDSHLPHSSPPPAQPRLRPSKFERTSGKNGYAVINQKRRVTVPQQALLEAGLKDGDWVKASSDGPGRVLLEKAGLPVWVQTSDP